MAYYRNLHELVSHEHVARLERKFDPQAIEEMEARQEAEFERGLEELKTLRIHTRSRNKLFQRPPGQFRRVPVLGEGDDDDLVPLEKINPLVNSELVSRVLTMGSSSVTKRGGRHPSMRAIVVVGNMDGCAGFGFGKADDGPKAVEDAEKQAVRDMIRIERFDNRTLTHDIMGKHNNVRVLLRQARPGYGQVSDKIVGSICDMFGLWDVVTKVHGGTNTYSIVHATFKAFRDYETVSDIARRRGMRMVDVNQAMYEHLVTELYKPQWADDRHDWDEQERQVFMDAQQKMHTTRRDSDYGPAQVDPNDLFRDPRGHDDDDEKGMNFEITQKRKI